VLLGNAVGGNDGGQEEGATRDRSETVREEDGSCHGWPGRDQRGTWTDGVQANAAVEVFDGDGNLLGRGTLEAGKAVDLDPSDDEEQWQCEFRFSVRVSPPADRYEVAIAGGTPFEVHAPAGSQRVTVPVARSADATTITECTDPPPDEVFAWQVAGRYWDLALSELCRDGVRIRAIGYQCSSATTAKERVVAVIASSRTKLASGGAVAEATVLEDEGDVRFDLETLAPGTPVVVLLSDGTRC
jgi:hypothetical protein